MEDLKEATEEKEENEEKILHQQNKGGFFE